jgi:hypothetical protein
MSGVQIFPVVCSSLCCCLISTKSKELCWERLRLSLRGCLYADWTACSFKCHRRRARCRLASFHEAGDLPISALTNGARVFVPLCVVGVRLTVAIHTFCGAEPRLQCVYLSSEVCDSLLHFQDKFLEVVCRWPF